MEVSEILAKYDTDKGFAHKYGKIYDSIFSKFGREAPLNILEVGTQKGGSLLAWKEYFPNANVVGVDIIDVVSEEYRKDTVTRVISDIKEWKNDTVWDIIIDDGSHYLGDMVWVITQYFVRLPQHGVIIIEDVRNPELLYSVIQNLLGEIKLGFPDLEHNDWAEVQAYDNRKIGLDCSFIMALFKKGK